VIARHQPRHVAPTEIAPLTRGAVPFAYPIESGLLATLSRKSPDSVFAVAGAIISVWSLRCAVMSTTSVRPSAPALMSLKAAY
jgi:hypothetical protein